MADYWTEIERMRKGSVSDRAAAAIAEDIRGRKGIGNELEQIDDETVADMLATWSVLIRRQLV